MFTLYSRLYGTTKSLKQRQNERLCQSFEPFPEAKRRVEETKRKILIGQKRKKDHVGNLNNYNFDKENCFEEVNAYSNDADINFTDLGKRFHLEDVNKKFPNNAGQIVKKFLTEMNCDLSRFTKLQNSVERIRRSKRK